ncbi:MAG TPA: hypothetical protein VMX57_01860, partial [Planctomycetota bacterium]|nr:hypothetical protein [Planctomycetota bacterium]
TLLVVVILFFLISVHLSSPFFGAPGLRFFVMLIGISLVFITIAGVSVFSSVISEEKEEQTLGPLKITGLNAFSILMGKGTSRILGGVFLLLVQFPFTLLAITLGGVSLSQVIAAYWAMVSYLLFVGGLSLFCSVFCNRTRTASGLTMLLLLGFLLGPGVGGALLGVLVSAGKLPATGLVARSLGTLFGWMFQANPFVRMSVILQTGFSESVVGVQVVSNLVLAVVFFLLSWLTFERFTRESPGVGPGRALLFKRTSRLGALGVGRAWNSALVWKEFYFGSGGVLGLVLRFVGMVLLFAVIIYFTWIAPGQRIRFRDVGGMVFITSMLMAYAEVLFHVGRTFSREVRWQTLSGLMLAPVSTAGVAYVKVFSVFLSLTPYIFFFLVGAVLAPKRFGEMIHFFFGTSPGWMLMFQALLLLYLAAYFSVVVKHGGIVVASAILFGAYCVVGMVFGLLWRGRGEPTGFLVFVCILSGFLILVLHHKLIGRLERKAGEG